MGELMVWFKVDDGLAFHPKTLRAGNAAMGLWVRAGAYCAQHLTDGVVSDEILPSLGTVKQAEALVSAGLWERAEGAWRFHEWNADGRQPTRASVEAERAATRERVRKHREEKAASRRTDTVSNTVGNAVTNGGGTDVPTRPDPTKEPKGSSEGRVSELRPDVSRLCTLLADLIEANGSKRPSVGKGWLDAARLMLDADKRPLGEAVGLIQWCQADPFWRGNILSMPKFREKYDQLRLQRSGREEKAVAADPYAGLEVVR